jgi:hypothetical protein
MTKQHICAGQQFGHDFLMHGIKYCLLTSIMVGLTAFVTAILVVFALVINVLR